MIIHSQPGPYSPPNSSVKSSTTMEPSPSETRDTFYFPGCKKDANCKCEICIASINATLDLMPQSIHRSSLTKLSVSRPAARKSPVFYPSPSMEPSTPDSGRIRPVVLSPPSTSTESKGFGEKVVRKEKRELGYGGFFVLRLVLGLIFVYSVELGVSRMVSWAVKARLSPDLVMNLGEISKGVEGLNGRFLFLKNELEGYLGEKVSSCGSIDSVWKINQEGSLLKTRCIMYKSMSEEVSIWGWPLQTAGLLTPQHSFRSFSILSGRVAEWNILEADYFVQTTNTSWMQVKWSSSVVQLDPNTWILEYRRSLFLENSRFLSTTLSFFKLRLMRKFEKLKQEFWLPSAFTSGYFDSTRGSIYVPT